MYLILTYTIDSKAADADLIESSLAALLDGRRSCDLLPGVRIAPLSSQADFLKIYRGVRDIAEAHPDALKCAAFAAETGSRMRCNVPHDFTLAREICSNVP
jgi:hypothetical protein